MTTRIPSTLAVCAVLASFATAAAAQNLVGNAAAGKQKASMCIGCHAIPGYRTAYPKVYHVPKIGGQQEEYIIAALKEYRAGERWHPSMRAIAGSLTDQDMADLAAYFAGNKK